MSLIGQGHTIIPAGAIVHAQRLLEMSLYYSLQRIAFGHPIAEYQAIQWMLADSAVEIEQVKWLVLNAPWKADQGGDARHEASIAKLAGAPLNRGGARPGEEDLRRLGHHKKRATRRARSHRCA